ncbi:PREDICTED: interferon lambda-4-like [Mandrillus leucophaeus]|uniref:interferon lambda-4-like n=1 Tax=Mandrillus leucophaeus TaxID=9568 RepID=UPI0005F3F690|nr:PREDICTED: interferon lambda-4-like [Mandrillus leucophaeus]
MRPSVWAVVAAGLWVLCTVVTAAPRRCLLSRYRSLEPWTLAAVKGLRVCYLELSRPGFSRKVPGAPRRRHKPRRADSPRCREVSVVFNLLRLLTWELRLVAHSGPCL